MTKTATAEQPPTEPTDDPTYYASIIFEMRTERRAMFPFLWTDSEPAETLISGANEWLDNLASTDVDLDPWQVVMWCLDTDVTLRVEASTPLRMSTITLFASGVLIEASATRGETAPQIDVSYGCDLAIAREAVTDLISTITQS